MADDKKPTIKLRFAPGHPELDLHPKTGDPLPAPSQVEIGNGPYSRVFKVEEQPFEVEAVEESLLLLNTGMFVVDEPKAKGKSGKAGAGEPPLSQDPAEKSGS